MLPFLALTQRFRLIITDYILVIGIALILTVLRCLLRGSSCGRERFLNRNYCEVNNLNIGKIEDRD